MLTQNELKEQLNYNVETGIFTRKVSVSPRVKVGGVAGGLNEYGYILIQVNKKDYRAHRLAWLYVYGVWPKGQIDLINGVKTDNRIGNLRDVTNRQNQQNTYKHRNGKLVGATYHKHNKKWVSQIYINGKQINLGYFNTEQEAHEAYLKFLEENGDKNNVGGIES